MMSRLSLIPLLFACGGILTLAACGGGGRGTVQQAELDEANDRAAARQAELERGQRQSGRIGERAGETPIFAGGRAGRAEAR